MTVETPSLFHNAIQEHLDLKRRNAELEPAMPINRYRIEDPFQNHPLFKTEEQAKIEDTLGGETSAPPEITASDESALEETEESLWGRSRDFDWGD